MISLNDALENKNWQIFTMYLYVPCAFLYTVIIPAGEGFLLDSKVISSASVTVSVFGKRASVPVIENR